MPDSGWLSIPKLTRWVCGTNSSSLGLKRGPSADIWCNVRRPGEDTKKRVFTLGLTFVSVGQLHAFIPPNHTINPYVIFLPNIPVQTET